MKWFQISAVSAWHWGVLHRPKKSNALVPACKPWTTIILQLFWRLRYKVISVASCSWMSEAVALRLPRQRDHVAAPSWTTSACINILVKLTQRKYLTPRACSWLTHRQILLTLSLILTVAYIQEFQHKKVVNKCKEVVNKLRWKRFVYKPLTVGAVCGTQPLASCTCVGRSDSSVRALARINLF